MTGSPSAEPIELRFDRARRIIRILPRGPHTRSEVVEVLSRLPEHPGFDPVLGRSLDLKSMEWRPDAEDVAELATLARTLPRHPHAGKTAFILDIPLFREVAGRYPDLSRPRLGRTLRVFQDTYEAEVWLIAPLFTPDSRGHIRIPSEAERETWDEDPD